MNTELHRQHQAFKQARARINGASVLRKEAQRISMGPPRPAIRVFSPIAPPIKKPSFVRLVPVKRDFLYVASIDPVEPPITVAKIQREVCVEFKIPQRELLLRDQLPWLVIPRHVSMYLTRLFTNKSFPEIARLHNRIDHSTSHYAFRKIGAGILADPALAARVSSLKTKLEAMRDA